MSKRKGCSHQWEEKPSYGIKVCLLCGKEKPLFGHMGVDTHYHCKLCGHHHCAVCGKCHRCGCETYVRDKPRKARSKK